MTIPVTCPHCGRGLQLPEELTGKQVSCPCGKAFSVSADDSLMSLLQDELDVNLDPLACASPAEWAKATGAPPEVTARIEEKLRPKPTSNANFMMGVAGAIVAVMLVIGLVVYLIFNMIIANR
ncbi:MAG: hypothetical protein JW818_02505 [Pirellulales bacterium]|nr:hypothetical protein [Pirellulales bacterium]